MKFPKEFLQDILLLRGCEVNLDNENYTMVEDRIIDTSRWSIHYRLVFKNLNMDKHYMTFYSRGATESQEEAPFEYEPDMIECVEVKPIEKKYIDYETIGTEFAI